MLNELAMLVTGEDLHEWDDVEKDSVKLFASTEKLSRVRHFRPLKDHCIFGDRTHRGINVIVRPKNAIFQRRKGIFHSQSCVAHRYR